MHSFLQIHMNTTVVNTTSLYPQDSQGVIIALWTTMCAYFVWTMLIIMLLFVRRRYQPVRVRMPSLLIYHMVACCFYVSFYHVRIIVGRNAFPCFLYSFIWFIGITEMFTTHTLRCFRFLIVFKWSKRITKIDEADKTTRILKKLLGMRWVFFIVVLLMFLQIPIWLFSIGIVSSYSKLMFIAAACRLGDTIYFALANVGVNAMVLAIMLVMVLKGVKDTWGIRLEIVFTALTWVVAMIVFAVMNFTSSYDRCCEYTAFPAGYAVLICVVVDNIITCVIPCVLSFRHKNNYTLSSLGDNSEILEDLDQVLINDQYRAELKDFAVKSFCPESLSK
jgi:hypothetical protein